VVGVGGVDNSYGDPGVRLYVEELATVYLGVDQEVLVVGVDPHDVGHRLAAGEQGGEGGKVLALGE
jgi:hypothetical protein